MASDTAALVEAMARKVKCLPDIEYLRLRLRYEPDTGLLFWRECECMPKSWLALYAGKEALISTKSKGHRAGYIDGSMYYAHRIAWYLYFGENPSGFIDHIDGDPSNNRIGNLRLATALENSRNQRKPITNTSGVMGVSWHKLNKKWEARIGNGKTMKYLGAFTNQNDAISARQQAEREYGYHINHGRTHTLPELKP